MGHIHVVGIGLDGASGLSETVQALMAQAELLVGSDRHLSYFPHHPAQRLPLGDLGSAISQLQAFIASSSRETTNDRPAVVLASGDPLFFGLGRLLLEQLPADQLSFHPHLNSVQLAFAKLKLPWQDAALISIHGRDMEPLVHKLLGCHPKIAVLTDPVHCPAAIAQLILSLSLPITYQCAVCENLGGQQERITTGLSLATLKDREFASLAIVVLTPVPTPLKLEALPLLGIADRHFATFPDRPGLMTKREVRSLILCELALQPNQVIWDIGAGTGSVSVEIAQLCPQSQVYAVERTAMGASLIEQNRERFATPNVQAIAGKSPEALAELPRPDRVFIGGSGGALKATLNHCERELQPGGRIVMAIATLETLAEAQQWFAQANWETNLLQVQLSKGGAIAKLTRWVPMNLVTLLTAWPQGKEAMTAS